MKTPLPCLVALPLVAALLGTGCLVIPVPREGRHVTASWENAGKTLVANAAAREVVMEQFGPPTHDFRDINVLGYAWSVEEVGFLHVVGSQAGGAAGYNKPVSDRRLWLAFDEQGRLRHSDLSITEYQLATSHDLGASGPAARHRADSVVSRFGRTV